MAGSGFPIPRAFDTWTTGLNASWELDIWGKFRRNIEAADAEWNASIEDYDAILVSLLAETAATYVELRTHQEQLAFARSNVEIQTGSLGIAQAQFDAGRVSELDVTQARAALKNTEQLVPLFEARGAQLQSATLHLARDAPTGSAPRTRQREDPRRETRRRGRDPGELTARRPDVRAAERRGPPKAPALVSPQPICFRISR